MERTDCMESLWTAPLQLIFVGIVYYAAYRHGFRASQAKNAAIVHEFSRPVNQLMEQLDRDIDTALEKQKKKQST